MKTILQKILEHQQLTYQEAKELISIINQNLFNEYQLVAILSGLQMRGVSIEELRGFQDALLELAVPINLSAYDGIDVCGTGGDGKNTFNISTTTALILASMGYKVIKHGNYGVSSLSGSSNVLESLGFTFKNTQKELEKELETTNLAILHAPLFHPTLFKVGKIRKELGVRTFFNCLGPLVNPAKPSYQLTGTFSLELARIYPFLLQEKRKNFKVTFGLDGYDELTLTANTKVLGKFEDSIYNHTTFNLAEKIASEDVFGGNSQAEAKAIVLNILQGNASEAHVNLIAANVATAIHCIQGGSLVDEFHNAYHHIKAGKGFTHFKHILS
jgi:anthranilate phosphoribosyltransferase